MMNQAYRDQKENKRQPATMLAQNSYFCLSETDEDEGLREVVAFGLKVKSFDIGKRVGFRVLK